MEIYHIENDVEVFGNEVISFPLGIDDAFKKLSAISHNDNRIYYGIACCADDKINYSAAMNEAFTGEADEYDEYEVYTIEGGDYLCITVNDRQTKTAAIKNVFEKMLEDERADKTKPAIEKYISDDEMLCLVKIKTDSNILQLIHKKAEQLVNVFAAADGSDINSVPFVESWSPAQVFNHLTKSNLSIAKAMSFEGTLVSRPADKRAAELRQMFLDYSVKFKSPEFILPEKGLYDKQLCIKAFNHSIEVLNEAASNTRLSEAITHPAFGEITKLELLYFVVFHLQRHLRQLNIILLALQEA